MSSCRNSMVQIIAATSLNGIIGIDNKIPWRYPQDLTWFSSIASGNILIAGRKTAEKLPVSLFARKPNLKELQIESHSLYDQNAGKLCDYIACDNLLPSNLIPPCLSLLSVNCITGQMFERDFPPEEFRTQLIIVSKHPEQVNLDKFIKHNLIPQIYIVTSYEEALEQAINYRGHLCGQQEIFVVGGESAYTWALSNPRVENLILSIIPEVVIPQEDTVRWPLFSESNADPSIYNRWNEISSLEFIEWFLPLDGWNITNTGFLYWAHQGEAITSDVLFLIATRSIQEGDC
jgi:dihydrofolate reductase